MVFGLLNESTLQETLRRASCWESELHGERAPLLSGALSPGTAG